MKIKYIFSVLTFLLFSLPFYAQQERITSFDVQVEVNQDRSITVTEYISVYAKGQKIKRGITRNFPAHRQLKGREVKMKYDIIKIEKNQQPEPYFSEYTNNDFTIYIGQRDIFLDKGIYEYMIQYRVPNQIGFFDDYDEIYWNAIGTDVSFKVEKGSCRISVPSGANIIQESAYTGRYGESGKDFTLTKEGRLLDYRIDRELNPREGFTVAVGFEKGHLDPPGFFEKHGTLIVILLGLIFLLPYYFFTWYRYGQDPATPASYPLFEAPDQLSSGSISYISKEGYQTNSLTASIIHLAIKGFIKIEEEESSGIFSSSKYFSLSQLKHANDSLPPEESAFLEELFIDSDCVAIDGEYAKNVEYAYKAHKDSLQVQHQTFLDKGNNTRFLSIPIIASIIIGGLAIFLFAKNPYAEGVNLTYIFLFIPLAILGLFLYHYLIKKPTVEKLDLKSKIKGYQMYLQMAEKDRLNLLNPPDMTPQLFEAALPFAFALGIEHQWSEIFKDILDASQYRPDWHNSSHHRHFTNDFGGTFSKNVRRSATKPQQSGGRGGGSGGGGFSGGGGGGGGVGGW